MYHPELLVIPDQIPDVGTFFYFQEQTDLSVPLPP